MMEHDVGPRSAQFWQDFAQTLTAISNSYLEISFAEKGGSSFNKAIYHESMDRKKLEQYAASELNVSFLAGCHRSFLPVKTDLLTKRIGSNQCIRQKNLLVFDADFKDGIEGYNKMSAAEQAAGGEKISEKILRSLQEHAIPTWLVVYSGHGLHIYFKLFTPIEIHPARYKSLYENIIAHLRGICGIPFDKSCSNPGRLIRLPLSTNWKNADAPVATRILAYLPDADGGPFVRGFLDPQIAQLTDSFKGKKELFAKLDIKKVLGFFNYDKFESLKDTGIKIICSSPFSEDSDPSLHYDKEKKLFFDFSTSRSGDLLNLIAFLSNLDIKNDFRTILQYARKIAGLVDEQNSTHVGRYQLKDNGVWFLASNDEVLLFCI